MMKRRKSLILTSMVGKNSKSKIEFRRLKKMTLGSILRRKLKHLSCNNKLKMSKSCSKKAISKNPSNPSNNRITRKNQNL